MAHKRLKKAIQRTEERFKRGVQSVRRRGKKAVRSTAARTEKFRPIATGVGAAAISFIIPGFGVPIATAATVFSAASGRYFGAAGARNEGLKGRDARRVGREGARKTLIAGSIGVAAGGAAQLIFGAPFAAPQAAAGEAAAGALATDTVTANINTTVAAQQAEFASTGVINVAQAEAQLGNAIVLGEQGVNISQLAAAGLPAGLGPSGGSALAAGTAAAGASVSGSAAAAGTLSAASVAPTGKSIFEQIGDFALDTGKNLVDAALPGATQIAASRLGLNNLDQIRTDPLGAADTIIENVVASEGGGTGSEGGGGFGDIAPPEEVGLARLAVPAGIAIGAWLLLRKRKAA